MTGSTEAPVYIFAGNTMEAETYAAMHQIASYVYVSPYTIRDEIPKDATLIEHGSFFKRGDYAAWSEWKLRRQAAG